MSERKPGWYWVKSPRLSGSREVAELDENKFWYFVGCDEPQPYSFVTEIGTRIPTPDEPWQCVPVEPSQAMLCASDGGDLVYSTVTYSEMLAVAPKP